MCFILGIVIILVLVILLHLHLLLVFGVYWEEDKIGEIRGMVRNGVIILAEGGCFPSPGGKM